MWKCNETLLNCLGKERCYSNLPRLTGPTVSVSLPIPLNLGNLRQLQTGEKKGLSPRPAPDGLGPSEHSATVVWTCRLFLHCIAFYYISINQSTRDATR